MSDDDARPGPDPSRLLDDVQRFGEIAAARVAEQFSRLLRIDGLDPEATAHGAATNGADAGDLSDALRTARIQAERAIDGAMTALSSAIDGYARVIEAALGATTHATPDATGSVEMVSVDMSDGHGSTSLWLHHDALTGSGSITLRVGPLVRSDGVVLAAAWCLEPDTVGPIAPGGSREVRLTVTGTDAAPGRYHGLVLASPGDLALRLEVDVTP